MPIKPATGSRSDLSGQGVLEMEGVSKTFIIGQRTVTALADISFKVKRGVVTGLIGPDGAGKTTVMRLMAGLLVPDRGKALVLGLDATEDSRAVQAAIGYMPQRFGLYEDLTVLENLDLYADLQGVSRAERPKRYKELLRMTGMAPFTDRLAGRLSGGMKQKLGIACTLIKPPELLLLDEPTVGVDPVSRRELWNIVYRQVEDEGMSVLLSTAYLDEAARCREVILLHDGHFLGQGEPDSFSAKLSGHSFMVQSSDESRRALQGRLCRLAGVTDAIILGDRIRLVTDQPSTPDEVGRRYGLPAGSLSVEAVSPRFEDAFITLLSSYVQDDPGKKEKSGIRASAVENSGDQDVIVVRKLRRDFGNFCAVKELSFSVRRGEIFGLLGANGAGKTTTFRMLCGLLPASSGTLQVAGRNLRKARAPARARIGYMAQKFSLYSGLTVLQNLRFFSSAYGLFGKKQLERIQWALVAFDLEAELNSVSGDLPLGYKQRLALAAALMHEPDILFLDEPTSGVDPLARREFWHYINGLAEAKVTVLVTTHFMEEAEYCDRLLIMARGEVLAAGIPHEMKKRCQTPEHPNPTMEDAFIDLIEDFEKRSEQAEQT